LILATAEFLHRLRKHAIHHRDLKASNIVVQNDPRSTRVPRIGVVDLEGISPSRFWRPRQRRQPLIRLAASLLDLPGVSRSDYARFLKTWLTITNGSPNSWKPRFRSLARQARLYAQASRKRKHDKLDGYAG
jgi:serine/threonine protein kinase